MMLILVTASRPRLAVRSRQAKTTAAHSILQAQKSQFDQPDCLDKADANRYLDT